VVFSEKDESMWPFKNKQVEAAKAYIGLQDRKNEIVGDMVEGLVGGLRQLIDKIVELDKENKRLRALLEANNVPVD